MLLTEQQLATLLRMKTQAIIRMRYCGTGPRFIQTDPSAKPMYLLSSVLEWIDGHKQKHEPSTTFSPQKSPTLHSRTDANTSES